MRGRRLVVRGRARLAGAVHVSGFKHALVYVVAGACCGASRVVIRNCPALVETSVLAELIDALGGRSVYRGNVLTIEPEGMRHGALDERLADRIHGSIYLLPALVARFGAAVAPTGGGCRIGNGSNGHRPFDHYVNVFERFGVRATADEDGHLRVSAASLKGCDIDLLDYTEDRHLRTGPHYSGASKLALLCAAVSHGRSNLLDLYPKPDVTELVDFLRLLGADIEGESTRRLVVNGAGPERLDRDVMFTLPADLIEIMTWICAGAVIGGDEITIHGMGLDRAWRALAPERALLDRMQVPVSTLEHALVAKPVEDTRPVDAVISSHGVYSDAQPFFTLLATRSRGRSRITDTVWQRRFDHVEGLNGLGARLRRSGASVTIDGGHRPHRAGQDIHANDLRSAAALLVAALDVEGETALSGAHHLARGYADLPAALRGLGANLEWTDE